MKKIANNINNLSKYGFIITRNAIHKKLVKDIQKSILFSLISKKSSDYKNFENIIRKKNPKNEYKFVSKINEMLFNDNYVEKIFLQKKIFEVLKH